MTDPPLHPLNQGFSWEPPAPPYRFLTGAQVDAYNENGFFVLEDVFDADLLSEVIAEIDPLERAFEDMVRAQEDQRLFIARADEITFTVHLAARSDRLRALVSGEALAGVCGDLLGADVRLYWDQAVYKKPGTEASFPWHQDNGYAFVDPQQYLTCWIALTDADEDNGCPWVVPGAHRAGTFAHHVSETGLVCFDHVDGAVPAPVGAGGMVVFSSLSPHCTGPNRTDTVRKAYIVQYAPDGAQILSGSSVENAERIDANAADRQFPILIGGQRVP